MFDTTIHLGDIVTSLLAAVVIIIGNRILRGYKLINKFLGHIEMIAEVVDEHSDTFDILGITNKFRSLSKKRRATNST